MAATAARVKREGGKWGKGGWNKGIPSTKETRKKFKAARKFCQERGIQFRLIGLKRELETVLGVDGVSLFFCSRFGVLTSL
jgi:hypothetical protein